MSEESFGVEEAGAFLNICRNSVLKLADSGELPGAKIGKEWVFLKSDVVDYLKRQIRAQSAARRARFEADTLIEKGQQNNPRTILTSVAQVPRVNRRKPLPELPPLPQSLREVAAA